MASSSRRCLKLKYAGAAVDLVGLRVETQGNGDLLCRLVVSSAFGQDRGLDRVGLGEVGVQREGPFGGLHAVIGLATAR